MKSGRGFHESCNEVYVKAYREEMPIAKLRNGTLKYAEDELVNLLPAPQHWEFTKSPWYFGLLVKKICRGHQLALNVADVMTDSTNVPVSRAAMRRNKQQSARRHNNAKISDTATPSPASSTDLCSVLTSSDTTGVMTPSTNVTSAHQDKLLWAKVIASKAHAETTNIAKRMGKMEELEKGMALLERMRPVIGEEVYANRVRSLFAALPYFKAFDTAVDIIDAKTTTPVVCTPGESHSNKHRTTKRHFSSDIVEVYTTTKRNNNCTTTITSVDDNLDDDDRVLLDDEIEEGEEEGNERSGGKDNNVSSASSDDEDKFVTYHGNVVDRIYGE